MNCKDCLHCEVCELMSKRESLAALYCAEECPGFKDKSDVQAVVRCKDCKFYKKDTDYCKEHNTGYCQFDNIVKCKLHFCGYGERRKEDGDA